MKTLCRLLLLVFMLFGAACSTVQKKNTALAQWLGADAAELKRVYGAPREVKYLGNGDEAYVYRVVAYRNYAFDYVPVNDRTSEWFPNGYPALTSITPDYTYTAWCTTFFVIDMKSKVSAWEQEGNACAK